MKTIWQEAPAELFINPNCIASDTPFPARLNEVLSPALHQAAMAEISTWPGYQPTPLLALKGLANDLGLGDLWIKDEDKRFALHSFKALGGAYAVLRVLQAQLSDDGYGNVSSRDLIDGPARSLVADITVTTATDGNHGRAVAWGAQLFGCKAVIYVPKGCSKAREEAIAAFGAEVRRTSLGYDDTMRLSSEACERNGWIMVSDTTWQDYDAIPRFVMQGYTVMAEEALAQMAPDVPSHVFLQGGVGGLAGAVAGHLWQRLTPRPKIIVVEAAGAPCLMVSAKAGAASSVEGEVHTIMAGLEAADASPLAWEIIMPATHAFMTLVDGTVVPAMKLMAQSSYGDPSAVVGESGITGLAGVLTAMAHPAWRDALALYENARVLLIGSEGATDPVIYQELTGLDPRSVSASP